MFTCIALVFFKFVVKNEFGNKIKYFNFIEISIVEYFFFKKSHITESNWCAFFFKKNGVLR